MKPSQVVALVIVVLMVAWGTLFYTILTTAQRESKSLLAEKTLLDQDTVILKTQRQTQTDLEGKITDLQTHIDCLFKIATTPHTTTNPPVVADPSQCNLTIPSSIVVTPAAPVKPVITSPAPTSSSQTSPHEAGGSGQASPQAAPTPKPPHPLLCTLTLKLIGCKG